MDSESRGEGTGTSAGAALVAYFCAGLVILWFEYMISSDPSGLGSALFFLPTLILTVLASFTGLLLTIPASGRSWATTFLSAITLVFYAILALYLFGESGSWRPMQWVARMYAFLVLIVPVAFLSFPQLRKREE